MLFKEIQENILTFQAAVTRVETEPLKVGWSLSHKPEESMDELVVEKEGKYFLLKKITSTWGDDVLYAVLDLPAGTQLKLVMDRNQALSSAEGTEPKPLDLPVGWQGELTVLGWTSSRPQTDTERAKSRDQNNIKELYTANSERLAKKFSLDEARETKLRETIRLLMEKAYHMGKTATDEDAKQNNTK